MKNSASKFATSAIGFLIWIPAGFAHIDPGTYVGKTAQGAECQMVVVRQYFENNVSHPLNERIVVQAGNAEFTVSHPPVIQTSTDTAFFNHDAFHAILPTQTGARALVIDMHHDQRANTRAEGPTGFHVMDHQWKSNTRQAIHCLGIRKTR